MSKKSVTNRNLKRRRLVAKYAGQRLELKEIIRSPASSEEQRQQAQLKLQSLPRDSSSVRLRNRCYFYSRGQGVYQRFGLCRNKLRELAMSGMVPGLVKSSW